MTAFGLLAIGSLVLSLGSFASAADTDWHPAECTADDARNALSKKGSCCTALSVFLGNKVTYPGSAVYDTSLASYWSLQEAGVHPSCILTPTSKDDVSLAVFLLNLGSQLFPGKCNFAVRSGGHTPFAGAASIESGVTIDLHSLSEVSISSDKSTVRIGPGNQWGNVYSTLDAQGVATSGGRVATVGVGGLVTGGGISFFSARYGFVCDNVDNFEVVLASGQVVNANSESNPDLWRAIRGGSNNLGIVTAFDMRLFQQGNFWGGFKGFDTSTLDRQFQAFEDLLGSPNYDPYAALIYTLVFDVTTNAWFVAAQFTYTQPVADPPFFQNFTSLPKTFSTTRISSLTDFTVEIAATNPPGRRQLFATGTYGNSAKMMSAIYQIGNDTAQPLRGIPNFAWSLSFQPEPTVITSKAAANGGNSLGLDASDGNVFDLLLTATWDNAADDALVNKQAKELFSRAGATATQLGISNPYIYLNYAAPWQDPISGYGSAAVSSLQAASRKYDPLGLFQKNVPGGFKLFR